MTHKGLATVAQLAQFDEILDARSPAEYADDHLPGAVSRPVLDDAQRAHIGTLYKQVSPFEARKQGAVLVARNVAAHIEAHYLDKPKSWRPLVYCWRGGQRSGAFSHILREIGWDAHRLEGGYKAWRRHVLATLAEVPARLSFIVVCGPTGSGKSRLLTALAARGAQVLPLEALAVHRGSLLGGLPDQPQPSQRAFETALGTRLAAFDPARPVYVEAESRRIGRLHLPEALVQAMHAGRCVCIDAPRAARVALLLADYADLLDRRAWLARRLDAMRPLQGHATVDRWQTLLVAGDFAVLADELLAQHYDPLYERSQRRDFTGYGSAPTLSSPTLDGAAIAGLAEALLVRDWSSAPFPESGSGKR